MTAFSYPALKFSCCVWALLAFVLNGQSVRPKPNIEWSPSLKLRGLDDLQARLSQPFGDSFDVTSQGHKVTVANCADYLKVASQKLETDNDRAERILHNDSVECVALNMLRSVKTPREASLNHFQMNAKTLRVLPAELSPAVSNEMIARAKKADAAGESWQSYVPRARAGGAGANRLLVIQPNWRTALALYARGDFTGNGEQQVLIRADYSAENGTYENSLLFLLGPGANGAKRLRLVREVPVP